MRDTVLARYARLLDLYAQNAAPGAEEAVDLRRMLEVSLTPEAGLQLRERIAQQLEREVDATQASLELLSEFSGEASPLDDLAEEEQLVATGIPGPGVGDRIRFAKLLKKPRYEITQLMAQRLPEIMLFTPALVDLEFGVSDSPQTNPREQVQLQELISRLSMRGHFGEEVLVLPMIGFDPRREYVWRWLRNGQSPLELLKEATLQRGFVGVKLYPPMGFKPLGNDIDVVGDPHMAEHLDGILLELYRWCADHDVPILAHGNKSNGARDGYDTYSHVAHWEPVLGGEGLENLRVCIGHAGGMTSDADAVERVATFASMTSHRGLYCDFSNHPIHASDATVEFLERVAELMEIYGTFGERIMFGSDWLMLEMSPAINNYFGTYADLVGEHLGLDGAFTGGTALQFLFGDKGANLGRVLERFRSEGIRPPDWLIELQ